MTPGDKLPCCHPVLRLCLLSALFGDSVSRCAWRHYACVLAGVVPLGGGWCCFLCS